MLAICEQAQGNLEAASQWLRQGIEAPGFPPEDGIGLRFDLGTLLLAMDRPEEAREQFQRLHPDQGEAALEAVNQAFQELRLRLLGPSESSEAIALHMSLVAGGTLLLVSLPHFVVPSPRALVPLLASAVAGGLGQVAMSRAYGLGRAARLSAVSYAGVVITYAFEALWFARAPGLHQWLGAALVCGAGIVVSARSRVAADADVPAPETGR